MKIHVEPTTPPMSWGEFVATKPPKSIALDGYVSGPPQYDPTGPWANLNHHEGVDRLATRATCAQALLGLRMGLFAPDHVFVDDCDEDVCLSTFVLANAHLCKATINPAVNRLVSLVDMLDSTAGSYPFPGDLPALGDLAWIMDPYRRLRSSGALDRKLESDYRGVIEDVGGRIMKHLTGNGGHIPPDTRFERVGGGKDWLLAREIGAQAKSAIVGEGYGVYVTFRERPAGGYTYVVGKTPYTPFDLAMVFRRLNETEGTVGSDDQWGGGNTIGGSPRVRGSHLEPTTVGEIVEALYHRA